jgi:hypothetical protein
MRLYSYTIPYDDGAAPNPFWGVCTLAICKPAIRRTASEGDWIVATGSKNTKDQGDLSNKVIYAMKVTKKMTLQEYDDYCRNHLQKKIADWENRDPRRRLGDCIYDFSVNPPNQRIGVHNEGNRKTDFGGKNVLLSDHFYYFGENPIDLCDKLLPIAHKTQGHKSTANEPYKELFVKWITDQGKTPNKLYGDPGLNLFNNPDDQASCSEYRATDEDIEC